MMRRLTRLGGQWAWIVLAAGAFLLSAAGYLLFTAFRFAQDAPTLFGGLPDQDGLAEPDGLAKQAAAVMQFSGHTPALLVLLAVMLLAGCLVLTGALPTTVGSVAFVRPESRGSGGLRRLGGCVDLEPPA